MQLWASCEIFQLAYPAENKVRMAVVSYVNAALISSNLAGLDCIIRYIPIIMPENLRQRYPARSELQKKKRIYYCAPQLSYDVFVTGTFESQLREYVRGLAESALHLADLGATPDQIAEFGRILNATPEQVNLLRFEG